MREKNLLTVRSVKLMLFGKAAIDLYWFASVKVTDRRIIVSMPWFNGRKETSYYYRSEDFERNKALGGIFLKSYETGKRALGDFIELRAHNDWLPHVRVFSSHTDMIAERIRTARGS